MVVLSERRNRREAERLRFPLGDLGIEPARPLLARRRRGAPVVVRPPPAWLLERDVTLPLAAAEELPRVLAYEMDRFTPFKSDEVHWGFHVQSRDIGAGVIRLRLSVVPRFGLLTLTTALERAGAPAALLEFPSRGGAVRTIRIDRPPTRGERRRRRALLLGVWGCVALALAVVAQPLVRQSLARAEVEDRIAALQPGVQQAEALRRRITNASSEADTIARERARLGEPLRILATVTQILPDDTFLTSFSLRDRTLTLEGQSAAAAKLIAGLSADPLIREPAFTAPVTRTEHGADLFALRAKIAP